MQEQETTYTFPQEEEPHEATWLQWPHHYQFGVKYRTELDPTWIAMAKVLVESEKLNIIAYNNKEMERITKLLQNANVALDEVQFYVYPYEDVWVRDNGPIYARNQQGELVIQDWGFNAWGQKSDEQTGEPLGYKKSNAIPKKIAKEQGLALVNLNSILVNEGGSIELDGNDTLMACRSSILNNNRNPNRTQEEVEEIFAKYLGVTNFIWLNGQAGLDVTDQHIDGFARFRDSKTIVSMTEENLLNYDVLPKDIKILYNAKNKEGIIYDFVQLPLTQNTVKKTDGTDLEILGSYINYYVANSRVLVPNYNDPNDAIANEIIQKLYPKRKVVGIDVRNLYGNGGMVHCVTQQQPRS